MFPSQKPDLFSFQSVEDSEAKPWRQFYPFDAPRVDSRAAADEAFRDSTPSWKARASWAGFGFARTEKIGFQANLNPWAKWDQLCDAARYFHLQLSENKLKRKFVFCICLHVYMFRPALI